MRPSLKRRIATKIADSPDKVFLTSEFADMGGKSQVLRALRQLCKEGFLQRVGYGVYVKTLINPLTGKPIAAADASTVMRKAFDKLGVDWEESQVVKEFNAGTSTQIPTNPIPTVKGRFQRKFKVNDLELTYRNG